MHYSEYLVNLNLYKFRLKKRINIITLDRDKSTNYYSRGEVS